MFLLSPAISAFRLQPWVRKTSCCRLWLRKERVTCEDRKFTQTVQCNNKPLHCSERNCTQLAISEIFPMTTISTEGNSSVFTGCYLCPSFLHIEPLQTFCKTKSRKKIIKNHKYQRWKRLAVFSKWEAFTHDWRIKGSFTNTSLAIKQCVTNIWHTLKNPSSAQKKKRKKKKIPNEHAEYLWMSIFPFAVYYFLWNTVYRILYQLP